MKLMKQMLIGAIVGFFGVYLVLSVQSIQFNIETTVIGLYIIIGISLVWSFILHRQIKQLNNTKFDGAKEDEVEGIKYRKFMDYSLLINSSGVLSLVALCMILITIQQLTLIIIGVIMAFISYFLNVSLIQIMRIVYPNRNIPKVSDPDYAKKLLATADEGEKHVMVQGLYKSHNLLNIILMFAMIGSTIYSIATESSQLFSVMLMGVVLLIVNSKYVLAVRNK